MIKGKLFLKKLAFWEEKYNLSFFSILLIGIALRFIATPNVYYLDGDATRDAIVARMGAKELFFPLTGPFSSTGPYTFGPWYYIILIATSIVFPFTYTPWIVMGILSVVTIILMYKIGKLLGSKGLGLILSLFSAITPIELSVGLGLSNINPIPFFATLTLYLAIRILVTKKVTPVLLTSLGLALGFGINMHYQMAGLLFIPLIAWYMLGIRKLRIPLFISFGIFLTFIPLLIFNLQNNWQTLQGIQTMHANKESIYVANSWRIYLLSYWPSFISEILKLPTLISVLIVIAGVVLLFLKLVRKEINRSWQLILIVLALNGLMLRFYWGERNFVYMHYLVPMILIIVGYLIYSLLQRKDYGKILGVVLGVIILGVMFLHDIKRIQQIPGDTAQQEIEYMTKEFGDKKIVLYTCNVGIDNHAQSLAYLLEFNKQGKTNGEKRLGVVTNEKCILPRSSYYDLRLARISSGFAQEAYPRLGFKSSTLVDFDSFSDTSLSTASWSAVNIHDVYIKTVKWYYPSNKK